MRKSILTIALFSIILSSKAQNKFTIVGAITQIKGPAKVYLSFRQDGKYMTDSSVVVNGNFKFYGVVEMPIIATLELKYLNNFSDSAAKKGLPQDYQMFFIENKKIVVYAHSNMKTATINGGKSQIEFSTLNSQMKPYRDLSMQVAGKNLILWKNADTTGRAALGKQSRELSSTMRGIEDSFIQSHSESYVSLHLLQSRANYIIPNKFEPLYKGLSAPIKNSVEGKALGERLAIVKKTSLGSMIINFTQPKTDQKLFTLSSLRGKYVLIDFWASWCGPCRGEAPHLREAYKQFKDKNFEIVSISVDEKKDRWLKAIQEDGMTWINVSDLKGFNNQVAATYGIKAIPRSFLIDPSGIIIDKNLRGEDLVKKLKQILEK